MQKIPKTKYSNLWLDSLRLLDTLPSDTPRSHKRGRGSASRDIKHVVDSLAIGMNHARDRGCRDYMPEACSAGGSNGFRTNFGRILVKGFFEASVESGLCKGEEHGAAEGLAECYDGHAD